MKTSTRTRLQGVKIQQNNSTHFVKFGHAMTDEQRRAELRKHLQVHGHANITAVFL